MNYKNSLKHILYPAVIALSIIVGIVTHRYFFQSAPVVQKMSGEPSKIDKLLRKITIDYVDDVKYDSLQEKAIPQIVENLDPHSSYIPARLKKEVDAPIMGEFDGIGVQFNIRRDTVMVIQTIAGGPSEKVGIMGGDRIVKVNDTVIAGVDISTREVMKKLKGKRGTKVNVSVKRPGTDELIDFEIIRDKIPLYSVDISYMLNNKTGYIKVNKFSRNTYSEFMQGANKLKAKGMKQLIVDLRGNGGGIMEAAIRMADEFLNAGKLIVYTQGNNRTKREYRASRQNFLTNIKVAVLIDEWSASASEIFAGALQDNDKGVIVGRRSFGKGLVQEPVYFDDGSELRLTVARYYTPTGRSIQKPYENGDEESYREDITRRYLNGEFMEEDSIQFADSLKFTTPGGKTVYGGGGIMPDIFVPVDTTAGSDFLYDVRRKGLQYSFAYDYTDKNRDRLKQFEGYQELETHLNNQNLLDSFVKFAKKKGINADPEDLKVSGKMLKTQITGLVARNILGDEGFYPIIHEVDTTLKRALEELQN
ncbi:putative CtpA-like serine protease [Salinivirga cyanobacteriivorans]|uniref:Putative CtpA-like serine protease n=1 Tax=Salinivirga cyanobacteriivorans TaxID=1307839 RepID=A0A0S2I189_9BACT|nr:S41 family peptidase [Salinivirga cyanobacteriivorans]ALO16061.1 putative CtpA-like serine protease [Salinivirga cyanobacteriivorans]